MHAVTQSKFATRIWGAPLSVAILLLALLGAYGSASATPRASSPAVHTVQASASTAAPCA